MYNLNPYVYPTIAGNPVVLYRICVAGIFVFPAASLTGFSTVKLAVLKVVCVDHSQWFEILHGKLCIRTFYHCRW